MTWSTCMSPPKGYKKVPRYDSLQTDLLRMTPLYQTEHQTGANKHSSLSVVALWTRQVTLQLLCKDVTFDGYQLADCTTKTDYTTGQWSPKHHPCPLHRVLIKPWGPQNSYFDMFLTGENVYQMTNITISSIDELPSLLRCFIVWRKPVQFQLSECVVKFFLYTIRFKWTLPFFIEITVNDNIQETVRS